MQKITIVCRNSPLSLRQVEEIIQIFPPFEYHINAIASLGDKNKHISLMSDQVSADFFTRELDEALLHHRADIAIHSAKDLPYPLPPGLEVLCLTAGAEKSDSLVSRDNMTLESLPPRARVGTSSKTRKEELLKLRPDLEIVSIRGTIEERIHQVDCGAIDALIVATCALTRLGLSHRIAQQLPFKTHPLQGNLAIVGRSGETALRDFFSCADIRKHFGKVFLVGFGSGNATWLTQAGGKALAEADTIFYDDLTDHTHTEQYTAEKIYVGKRCGQHSFEQDEINNLIYEAARQGKTVARLKGGDPMIFAHGREEIDYLRSRLVEVDIIPGITAASAFSACTGIPLTHRGMASSVAFVTGHHADNLKQVNADTIVIYMGATHVRELAQQLISNGKDRHTPVALAHALSTNHQQLFISHLQDLQYTLFSYPTPLLIVVGEVVSLDHSLRTSGKTLYTGTTPPPHVPPGEQYVHSPLIKITVNHTPSIVERLKAHVPTADWIIFTSRYAVYAFRELMPATSAIEILKEKRIISVGPSTTHALTAMGITPFWESDTESASGIIRFFRQQPSEDVHILLPRSDKGLPSLSDKLRRQGFILQDIPVYINSYNPSAHPEDLSKFSKIVFSSPSCIEAFIKLYGALPTDKQLVGRGESTYQALKEHLTSINHS